MTTRMKVASVLVCLCAIIAFFTGCNDAQPDTPPASTSPKTTYSIAVETASGAPVTGVGVFVYEDESRSELVCVATTDETGIISFVDVTRDSYVAILRDLPIGFTAEESYPLTGETTAIVLAQGELTDEDMDNVTFSLGDALMDFSVTDCEGTEYTLSELLTKKKAVVLNFWYLNCAPCKMEFPYLQEAYDEFGDDIELLAMNPVDGDDTSISEFKLENKLSFPMSACDDRWQEMMKLTAYPTTVIVDRYGNICLVHRGMFTDSATLINALEYFTTEDYQQVFFESIEEVPQ